MATAKREQLIQEAEKLAAKGKLDAAIEQFQKAVKQGSPDGVLLNRLGDLLLKANRVEEAVAAYQQAADVYAQQGFTLKAIAAEKKANRADPQRTDTYERLADFYYRQGMPVEGRQQLLTLADWYQRSRKLDQAIHVYRKVAQWEPGNFQVRAKLVDLLAAKGDAAGASAEVEQLGQLLLSRGHVDESVKLVERALEMGLALGSFGPALLDALVATGRLPTALDVVRKLHGPRVSPPLAVAMARVLLDAGDIAAARQLVEQALPEIGERTEVVQLYGDILLRVGEAEAAKEKLLPTIDRLMAAHDLERAGQLLKRLLKANPRDIEVLERGLKVFDRRRDGEFFAVLEGALADAYYQAGRRQEAAELYMELYQREPNNNLYRQRLQELGVGPTAAEIVHVPRRGLGPTKGPQTAEELEVEIPLESLEEEPAAAAQAQTSWDWEAVASMDQTANPVPPTGPQPSADELFTEASVLAKYGLVEKALTHLQQLLALDPSHAKGRELLASLGGRLEEVEEEVVAIPAAPAVEPPRAEQKTPTPVPATPPPPRPAPPPPAKSAASALEELEELLGLTARKRAPAPEQRRDTAPALPEVSPGLALGEGGGAAVPEGASFAVPQFELADLAPVVFPSPSSASVEKPPPSVPEVLTEPVELVELAEGLQEPSPDQLAELDLLLEQGLAEQAKETYQRLAVAFPESQELARRAHRVAELAAAPAAVPEGSATELFAEEEGFFNLAEELERELAEEEDKQLVAQARGEEGVGEESIEELFKKFQRGVAEQLGAEDYATHFDLGLAYREMGLLDEAIGEFQLVLKSPELALDALTLIANCYRDKGLPEEAASWFEKALATPSLAPETELGLRYELGRAWEAAGNIAAALGQYAEVLAVNPTYRDVVERITRLRNATN
ncbi:MAG: tetratricopeptide repeat protein [Thermoanaerobaculum sp.]|nr:tetratricopeptide repeat protein [Thermoanaerobaculum sp.]MDW7967782.1 tetratricopeptide repeat protein [Thermoanaerobaculum sp.]